MAEYSDFDTPDLLPPPAYEFCQEEFDRKVSYAVEESQTQSAAADDEDFEIWDEAAFAAAAARFALTDRGEGSSSSLRPAESTAPALPSPTHPGGKGKSNDEGNYAAEPAIQPLRIVKKAQPPPPTKEKERPSWYAEAQLDGPPPPAPAAPAVQSSSYSQSYASSTPPRNAYPEREPTPPPMFTAVADSLDGPPYEEAQETQSPGLVLSYIPGDSRPASPLHSPTSPTLQGGIPSLPSMLPPVPSYRSYSRPPPQLPEEMRPISPPISPPLPSPVAPPPVVRPQYQSAPPPPRQSTQRTVPRPMSSYNLPKAKPYTPRLAFDHSIAYGEKSSFQTVNREEPLPPNFDVSSLYNSSVASLYSSAVPSAPRNPIPPPPPSSFYMQSAQTHAQHSYTMPPSAMSTSPQGMGGYPPSRTQMKSPAPSVHSITQAHSPQPYAGHPGYQAQQPSYQAPGGYQPTNYRPTGYQQPQQQSYQPTSYQTTSYQSTQYQPTGYQQSAPQQNPYQQPTFRPSGYQPTSY